MKYYWFGFEFIYLKFNCRYSFSSCSKYFSGSGLVRVHLSTIFEVQVWFRFTQVKYYWFGFEFIYLKFNCRYSFRPEKKGEIADPVDDLYCSYCACTSASGIQIWKNITFVRGSGSVWVHLSTILRVQAWFRFTEVKVCWFRFGSGSPK